ncbi:rhamnogalacturonan endolyase [Paraburkholderia caballeronis]|uniref:polysaccharide lyase family protein n=1 Tax=Paraburkholderia caballeronis TaxID=416943 RepID=UPI001066674F|nr:polysaccharide lyase family protein [Paraburkholderia caballeronis]TDV39222.1 rhamnogalacturonan endolyase [Paraburkholderia caballeronis]
MLNPPSRAALRRSRALLPALALCAAAAAPAYADDAHPAPVTLTQDAAYLTLENGLVQIRVERSDGYLASIRQHDAGGWHDLGVTDQHAAYEAHGDDFENDPEKAMYWDANADVAVVPPGLKEDRKGYFRIRDGEADIRIVSRTADRAEVSVRSKPTPLFPFDVDFHYVVTKGKSGFYAYAVVHHGSDQPAATFYQNRFVVKTVMDGTFDQWAIGGGKFVPIPQGEIVKQLSDATFQLSDGTIKTKYMNSVYWSQVPVYGYVGPHRGLWMIEASPEYHNGGPVKQGQTLHDNVLLRVLQSVHFGASPVVLKDGEEWRKVYGPFFVYLNRGEGPAALWQDAARQHENEAANWPYAWVDEPAYQKTRGEVSGAVTLAGGAPATNAWAILSDPDVPWSAQNKGYAFWSTLGPDGRFDLKQVIPGTYDLYVSGADQPQDLVVRRVKVLADGRVDLGTIAWPDEAHGERLWQIGRFDRSAAEFRSGDDARNFQMFRRYAQQFPHDVDYVIGESQPARDWNYAQWTLYNEHPEWRIRFDVPHPRSGTATLTIGFASSQPAHGRKLTDLRVKVNGTEVAAIHLPKTGTAGYRGGAQDSQYNVRAITFDAALLKAGSNAISLYHADAAPFARFTAASTDAGAPANTTPGQVMYDALRLEVEPAASP